MKLFQSSHKEIKGKFKRSECSSARKMGWSMLCPSPWPGRNAQQHPACPPPGAAPDSVRDSGSLGR